MGGGVVVVVGVGVTVVVGFGVAVGVGVEVVVSVGVGVLVVVAGAPPAQPAKRGITVNSRIHATITCFFIFTPLLPEDFTYFITLICIMYALFILILF